MNSNQGCGVSFTEDRSSYGQRFNQVGGGYYVMSRTRQEGIKIWFWARGDPDTPPEILGDSGLDLFCGFGGISSTSGWGQPSAFFPVGDTCDYDSHFNAHMMVFDLTFCVSAVIFSTKDLHCLIYYTTTRVIGLVILGRTLAAECKLVPIVSRFLQTPGIVR